MSLPEGWVETTLGAVCSKPQYGYTTKASNIGDLKFLRTTDITKKKINWDNVPYCLINPDKPEKYLLKNGDILISRAGSVGFSCLLEEVKEDTVFASYLIRFKPNFKLIDEKFLFHFLKSPNYWKQITDVSAGVAVQNINAKKLGLLKLTLPSLTQQKQIAQKLDQVLARVERIKMALDNTPNTIKRFRQSVLALAVSGGLSDEGIEWKILTINDVLDSLQQGWSPKCENIPAMKEQWGVIKTSSVQKINFIETENKLLPTSLEAREHLSLKKGDILITRAGPRVRCAVTCHINEDFNNLIICDKVYRVRVDKNKILSKYLVFLLNSKDYLTLLERMKTGISDSGLNLTQKKFKSMEIKIPNVEEQQKIVKKVETLFTLADNLEKRVNQAQKQVDRLTQSILAKAFRGEL